MVEAGRVECGAADRDRIRVVRRDQWREHRQEDDQEEERERDDGGLVAHKPLERAPPWARRARGDDAFVEGDACVLDELRSGIDVTCERTLAEDLAAGHGASTIGRSLLAGIPRSLTLTTPPPLVVRYSPGYPARSRSRRP